VFDRLLEQRCERKRRSIALGGGVIGDITGFARQVYLRGVPFIPSSPPRCWRKWIPQSAARPASIIRWVRT
jgi:hypothetical protein